MGEACAIATVWFYAVIVLVSLIIKAMSLRASNRMLKKLQPTALIISSLNIAIHKIVETKLSEF